MMAFGPSDLKTALGASDDAIAALERHFALLSAWAPRINLVGPRELAEYWQRHALDCGQIVLHAPGALRWIDLGSGAGFPGLVIACLLKGRAGAIVTLVEPSAKRAAFLREAVRAASAPAQVVEGRAEDIESLEFAQTCDVITARALAPLKRLIEHASPVLIRGAQALFLKGAEVDAELSAAGVMDNTLRLGGGEFQVDVLKSLSDPSGRIVRIQKRTAPTTPKGEP